jgi:hypothetical protein
MSDRASSPRRLELTWLRRSPGEHIFSPARRTASLYKAIIVPFQAESKNLVEVC